MRITQSMYYDSIYSNNNSKLNKELFDVNRQIASGLKIQYASDDVRTFTETMRLDNELTTLGQIKKSTESGYKFSNQTDVTMNEFTDSMNRMRTLLVQAANDVQDDTSLDAIADELRGIENNLMSLANTSINGQYLFSGSATNVKPIDENGNYHGNDIDLKSFVGSNNQLKYNITGENLFLGEESKVKREITTNVVQKLNNPIEANDKLTQESSMLEFMGDSPSGKHYFYLRGVQHNGNSFNEKIDMDNAGTVEQLMNKIGEAYGNIPGKVDVVNVRLNNSGQIVVEDKIQGSSKLDFHMIGATDFNAAGIDEADKGHIDGLSSASTDYDTASSGAGSLYVKEFILSGLSAATGVTGPDANQYDRTEFTKSGEKLSSNVSQILKSSHFVKNVVGQDINTISDDKINSFAQPSTLLSEVADISKGTIDTSDDTLAGSSFTLQGKDINNNDYDISIDFDKSVVNGGSGSTFTDNITGNTYTLFNLENPRVATDADEVTYQQLMDVMNIAVTGNINSLTTGATTVDSDNYDDAIKSANFVGSMALTKDAKIEFTDLNAANTRATIALYDSNSGNFTNDIDSDNDGNNDKASSSIMSFNANNSLTVRDPKTDFFKTINEMIEAVENHTTYPDASLKDKRTVGIENAIAAIDDLQDHVFRNQSVAGAQSNTLTAALERTEILEISTFSLRSSVVDTDLAESSLRLSQLTLNYQAMLSTVGKVSQLSLVNYL